MIRVADGRLTLRSASTNTPICFVEIARVDAPVLSIVRTTLSRENMELRFVGEAGFRYPIETSTDLESWNALGPATPLRGAQFQFFHTNMVDDFHRFYRAVLLPDP